MGAAQIEGVVGRAEAAAVVLGRGVVVAHRAVVVVVADKRVDGDAQLSEESLYAGHQLGRVPDDVAQNQRGLRPVGSRGAGASFI